MKSSLRPINVVKRLNLGHMPVFVSMMHKHLEKEQSVGSRIGSEVEFRVPIDLLKITVGDVSLLRDLAEVTFVYQAPRD